MLHKHTRNDGCLSKVISFNRPAQIAEWLLDGAEVGTAYIQDEDFPLGLDLSSDSCALCGGFFAHHGQVFFGYFREIPRYFHLGCRAEALNWTDRPYTDDAA